jgi:hypothetical protein
MAMTHKKRGNARKRAARGDSLTLGLVTSLGSIGKDVAGRKAARGLLSGFATAIKRAERTGKSVRMTVMVDPKSAAPHIAVEEVSASPKEDMLDTALASARQRGSARVAEILNGTDMLSADAFAEEIGATRETVHKKRRRHEVLGLEGPKRGVRFPKWQVSDSGGLIPSLPQLFEALGDRPWTVYRFLLEEHGELDGRTGLDALRAGRIADVMATAETIGRGGFS